MDEIVNKVLKGEIMFYRVEEHVGNDVNTATEIRRKVLERMKDISLENIGKYSMDMNLTAKRNIENSIGCAQIPIGIAGPLKVTGDYIDEEELPLILGDDAALKKATPIDTTPGDLPLEEVEKASILKTLESTRGNKSEAARRLGITRKTLHKKLKAYGVMP